MALGFVIALVLGGVALIIALMFLIYYNKFVRLINQIENSYLK